MKRYGIATLFETYPDGYEFTEANTPPEHPDGTIHATKSDALNDSHKH